jgi:hypothetical protein
MLLLSSILPLADKFQSYLLGSCSKFRSTQIVKAKNERFAVEEPNFVPLLASHDAASKLVKIITQQRLCELQPHNQL